VPQTLEAWAEAKAADPDFGDFVAKIKDVAVRNDLYIHAPSDRPPRIIVPLLIAKQKPKHGWTALGFHFRLARLKQPHWPKIWKALSFSEPKQPTAEKNGFGGEGEVQGKFVTSAMGAFRRPDARVKIHKKAQ
jgi:hypothetical protein